MIGLDAPKRLTRYRIAGAFGAALLADGAQILLGPLGWGFFDEIIDVIAMGVTCVLLGFHPLLLPTFLLELLPIVDMIPTWTACVAAVVFLRRNPSVPPQTRPAPSPPESGPRGNDNRPPSPPVIDV